MKEDLATSSLFRRWPSKTLWGIGKGDRNRKGEKQSRMLYSADYWCGQLELRTPRTLWELVERASKLSQWGERKLRFSQTYSHSLSLTGTSVLAHMSFYHPKAKGIWTGYLQHLFYMIWDVMSNLHPQNSIQGLVLQMTTDAHTVYTGFDRVCKTSYIPLYVNWSHPSNFKVKSYLRLENCKHRNSWVLKDVLWVQFWLHT